MGCHRRTLPLLLLAPLFLTLSGCDSFHSPTEPASLRSVHLSAHNHSATALWVRPVAEYQGFELRPGASMEFKTIRSTYPSISPADDQFHVLLPTDDGTIPTAVWATVQYHIDEVRPKPDLYIAVNMSIDAARSLVVTSNHPDLFHVVRVSYP